MHDVLLERSAERDPRALPRQDLDCVVDHIRALARDPRPPGSRKITGSQSDWRIRVGSYRIIYEVDDAERCVGVMRVRHRDRAYR